MTSEEKCDLIEYAIGRHRAAVDAENGDRHLADPGYLIEAIEDLIGDNHGSSVVRMFMEPGHG